MEHRTNQSSPWNICLRNTYSLKLLCWWLLEDILKAIFLPFKAITQAHIFVLFSTTVWRSTARQWAGSGNPNLHRFRTWTTLTLLFPLQCQSVTVLSSSPTPTQWYLQTRFGEHVIRSSVSWTLPQFLKASSWCTASRRRSFPTRAPTHSYRRMISTLAFATAFPILRM